MFNLKSNTVCVIILQVIILIIFMKTLAITGTNTDIGKTYAACGILISASGVNDTVEEVNPFFFEPPLAPYHAIKLNGGDIDIGKCIAAFDVLRQKHDLMIVEGAGGIMVPIMETQEGKGSGNYKPFMAYSKGLWRSGIKCKGFYF